MRKVLGRFARVGVAIGSVLATASTAPAAAQDRPRAAANAVKAAYLLNFTRYVEWPARAFQNNGSAIVICVIGADPFGAVLDDIVRDRQVEGRPIEVRRQPAPAADGTCHVAFLHGGTAALKRAQRAWPTSPVLLVGDGTSFAAAGGIIAFIEAGETIRFQINAGAARARGVQISSRVMALATRVYGTRDKP